MGRERDVYALGATIITVGLSAIVQVGPTENQIGLQMKKLAGNTLEIVSRPPALTGSSAVVWGTGYKLGDTETLSIDGPARYYLAATGATVSLGVIIKYSQGATIGAPL